MSLLRFFVLLAVMSIELLAAKHRSSYLMYMKWRKQIFTTYAPTEAQLEVTLVFLFTLFIQALISFLCVLVVLSIIYMDVNCHIGLRFLVFSW